MLLSLSQYEKWRVRYKRHIDFYDAMCGFGISPVTLSTISCRLLLLYNRGMRKINIPTELIKKYKGSKQSLELFAFAVCIKMLHTNSVLTNVSYRKIATLLHISRAKAKRILEQAKENELFDYNSKTNTLRVVSFKNKDMKQSSDGRRKYISDYCFSPSVKEGCVLSKDNKPLEYRLQAIYNILRESLIANAINSEDRNDSASRDISVRKTALTQQKLSNIAGMKRTSLRNALKRMKQSGKITVTSAVAMCVISSVNAESVEEWRKTSGRKNFIYNPNDNSGWIIKPCEYSITDRSYTECFRHVIYNHKNRVQKNHNYDDFLVRYHIVD